MEDEEHDWESSKIVVSILEKRRCDEEYFVHEGWWNRKGRKTERERRSENMGTCIAHDSLIYLFNLGLCF